MERDAVVQLLRSRFAAERASGHPLRWHTSCTKVDGSGRTRSDSSLAMAKEAPSASRLGKRPSPSQRDHHGLTHCAGAARVIALSSTRTLRVAVRSAPAYSRRRAAAPARIRGRSSALEAEQVADRARLAEVDQRRVNAVFQRRLVLDEVQPEAGALTLLTDARTVQTAKMPPSEAANSLPSEHRAKNTPVHRNSKKFHSSQVSSIKALSITLRQREK